MTSQKFFKKLTLRIEIYLNIIVVPFSVLFCIFANQFDMEKSLYFIGCAAVVAGSLSVCQIVIRYRILHPLLAAVERGEGDLKQLKIKLLNFPRIEAIGSTIRWIAGISLVWLSLASIIELKPIEHVTFTMVYLFAVPISAIISFLTSENMLSHYYSDSKISGIILSKNELRTFSVVLRNMLTLVSIILIPVVCLGYLFYISANMYMKFENLEMFLILFIVLSGLTIGISIYELLVSTHRSIGMIKTALGEIREGNLSRESVPMIVRSEIGAMTQDVSVLLLSLKKILASIRESSETVLTGSDEISSSAEGLSSAANNEAATVEEVSSSMEEMSASIQINAENAERTNKFSIEIAARADEGGTAMRETVEAMKLIAEKVTLVDDIAYQTGLLALNASIEAARAGKSGMGFAVVAAEVRRLSERTQEASREISELVGKSVGVTDRAGEIFETMLPEITKSAQLVQEVYNGSQEQNRGADQINRAIQQLSQISQENAASSEELSSTSELLRENVKSMFEKIEYFKI